MKLSTALQVILLALAFRPGAIAADLPQVVLQDAPPRPGDIPAGADGAFVTEVTSESDSKGKPSAPRTKKLVWKASPDRSLVAFLSIEKKADGSMRGMVGLLRVGKLFRSGEEVLVYRSAPLEDGSHYSLFVSRTNPLKGDGLSYYLIRYPANTRDVAHVMSGPAPRAFVESFERTPLSK
jgi:hypothetical protein